MKRSLRHREFYQINTLTLKEKKEYVFYNNILENKPTEEQNVVGKKCLVV